MEQQRLICGIDVSKNTLDFCYNKGKKMCSGKVKNTAEGHAQLFKLLKARYTYVMESTGIYALRLNYFLNSRGADIRVMNALIIRRFIQMNMERNKSDKVDARWILRYALANEGPLWQPPSRINLYCTQLLSSIDFYKKQSTMLKNYLKNLELYPFINSLVQRSCKKALDGIESEIEKMEAKLDAFLSRRYAKLKDNLTTIPGLGKRAIAYLIIFTNGFKKFQTSNQLIAYAGLAPKEYASGTMEAKKKICKMGNANLRKTLYMCSMTAIRTNKSCKEKYNRLKEKGKNGKLALIAVCNKLIRQAFAIAKKGVPYQDGHVPTMPASKSMMVGKVGNILQSAEPIPGGVKSRARRKLIKTAQ